jgi:formylglycine-generating enzyme required for sulfatase activity/serine/threonine protein kinase
VWRSLPRGFVIEDKWRIVNEIGRGGMASVYRAEGIDDINKDEIAAIKIPAPSLLDDGASRQRFIGEIKISQKLSRKPHTAIVQTLGHVHLTDTHTGRALYGLVLEFIDGQTLANWLAQRHALGQDLALIEVFTILDTICAALEHAHGQTPPILHSDLKPANIMVTHDEQYKLMDFGIARILEDSMQTLTGSVMGTWGYLPPEFHGPHYQPDVRSDVYLAANLLVELMTFHPKGNAERRSDCPKAWLKLIGSAMNPLLSERPASIRDFREQLRAGLAVKPDVELTKPPEKQTPRTPTVQERKHATQQRAVELANQNQFAEAFKLLSELPPELQDISFTGKFQLQQRDRVHHAARQMAEKEYKYAAAVALLEKLSPTLRDATLMDKLCEKRDEWVRLDHDIRQRFHAGRFSDVRGKLRRLLELEPTNADMRELFNSLGEEREIVNSIGMILVLVEPGVFLMGSPPGEAERDNEHQHEVEITQPFYAGIYLVTQEQYHRVMDQTPSWFSSTGSGEAKVENLDTRQFPVESVTHDDAVEFCRRLSELPEEKENGYLYRLPTEAEWEYICRGGPFFKKPSPPFYFGNSLSPSQANFNGNYPYGGAAEGVYLERPTKVGSYPPNPLGLYDLHGNVWEWCADWYDKEYYKHSPRKDPQGPEKGKNRVLRGGAWYGDGRICRAACRNEGLPSERLNRGFRVVLVVGARK